MENPWFRKGFNAKSKTIEVESKEMPTPNADGNFGPCGASSGAAAEAKIESPKPTNLNAFDIISLSTGFDLSGLFVENDQKEQVQFTSAKPASAIISRLEEIGKHLKLKVVKKDGWLLKFERPNEGARVALCIDIELFEITSSFHAVEVKKSRGDVLEYQKILKLDIRPALKDIVWAWQGEEQQQQQQQ